MSSCSTGSRRRTRGGARRSSRSGAGDKGLLARIEGARPFDVVTQFVVDENLAHRVYAAADFFLMPSRFEPCGLGQLYAMAYGALPIVSPVGGLLDTVVDAAARSRHAWRWNDAGKPRQNRHRWLYVCRITLNVAMCRSDPTAWMTTTP